MFALRAWSRGLLAAMLLLILSPFALAQPSGTKSLPRTSAPTTEISHSEAPPPHEKREPSGNAFFGVLIIGGVIGLLVLVAWIFSRIGEGPSRQADNTLN
jgi:hypothetical protein